MVTFRGIKTVHQETIKVCSLGIGTILFIQIE